MFDKILSFDYSVEAFSAALRGSLQSNFLAWIISASVGAFIILLFYYFLIIKRKGKTALNFTIGLAILYAVISIIKKAASRARPDLTDNLSFPSRHTALAFFIAIYLPVKPKVRMLLLLWAAAVAVSRLWLAAHWFSDVLLGAGIGITAAIILKKVKKKN